MENVIVRKGRPDDAKDFSKLVLFSSKRFYLNLFGPRVKEVLENLFRHRNNSFSFDRSYFIEVDGHTAGLALLCDYKEKNAMDWRDRFLVPRYMKLSILTQLSYLLKAAKSKDKIKNGECYLSDLAVYPKFRQQGMGERLLKAIEKVATAAGNRKMTLKVEVDNKQAIRLYRRAGYKIEGRMPAFQIRNKKFEFFKAGKRMDLEKNTTI